MMNTYDNLTPPERQLIEDALDELKMSCAQIGIRLSNQDAAARAAEALAVYIVQSEVEMEARQISS